MNRISGFVAAASANLAHAMGFMSHDDADGRTHLIEAINGLLGVFRELPMPPSLVDQAEQIRRQANDKNYPDATLVTQAGTLQRAFYMELMRHLFFVVPESHKSLYLDPRAAFGASTVDRFHDSARDVRDACQCVALGQWTAAVFHSMRILERGLLALAEWVGLDPVEMALENWKNIIDQIESRLRNMEGLPKSPAKSSELRFFSEAATQFRYFKDAWRNHVSHARESYDEQSATTIFDHVRDFMAHLAKRRVADSR